MISSFDGICIIIALFFTARASRQYQSICFIVLCWFVISEVVYNHLFLELRAQNNWLIYIFYNVINVIIALKLLSNQSHNVIISLISLNILLNIVVSMYFAGYLFPIFLYHMYPYIAASISVAVLIYMWDISNGARFIDRLAHNKNNFIRLLCIRYGVRGRGLL